MSISIHLGFLTDNPEPYIHLLQDAVNHGASIGFHAPLGEDEARQYWEEVGQAIAGGHRILLVARENDRLMGAVQLDLAKKPNATHRAEVQKLMVLSSERRKGIGRVLMEAAEDAARDMGRTLLTLDTRTGDAAEALYHKLGYQLMGIIPSYTRDADGTFFNTSFFFKTL